MHQIIMPPLFHPSGTDGCITLLTIQQKRFVCHFFRKCHVFLIELSKLDMFLGAATLCNLEVFFFWQVMALKPTRYGVAHRENLTGRGDGMVYHTKGHALNPNKRDWKRYQSWQPENPDSESKSSPSSPNSV